MKLVENNTEKELNGLETRVVEWIAKGLHNIQEVLYLNGSKTNITLICRDVENGAHDVIMSQEEELEPLLNSIRIHFNNAHKNPQ